MSIIDKWFLKIFSIYRVVQVICILLMSILVFLQVILREVFSIGIQWAYELSCFMQITMVWLGMPILLMKDSNIQITLIYDKSPATVKRALDFLKYVVYVCCAIFLTWGYILYVQNLGSMKSAVLRLPNNIFYGSILFGIIMMIAVLVFKAKVLLRIGNSSLDEKLKGI